MGAVIAQASICTPEFIMQLSAFVLLSLSALALSKPADENQAVVADRYKSTECPIRNQVVLKGWFSDSCVQVQSGWTHTWEECGTNCSRDYRCEAWTFTNKECKMYGSGCDFTTNNGYGSVSGLRQCTN